MIYIVEDDANIRQLVVYTFNNMSMEAAGFENAADFWKAMGNNIPELV